MLLGTFAWSFVYVSLPFHIQKMSTLDAAATLRWTGWILGISPLITVITAPISGRIGERIDPKRGFVAVQAFQGLGFLGMALARTLPEMLVARVLLGLMGAVSTFAFIMVGRSGGDVRRQVSYIQSGMTLGQVLGPAVGAVVAARLGFHCPYPGRRMLWLLGPLAWGVPPGKPREPGLGDRRTSRASGDGVPVVLTGSTQTSYRRDASPQILPPLGVSGDHARGQRVPPPITGWPPRSPMARRAGAAPGRGGRRSARAVLVPPGSSVLVAALAGRGNVWSFGCSASCRCGIAPVFPLLVGRRSRSGGRDHRIRQLGADRGGLHRAGRGDDAAVVHAARRRLPGAGRDGAVGDPARGAAQPPRATVGRGR